MSDIPKARAILLEGMKMDDVENMRAAMQVALGLMIRRKPVRKGPVKNRLDLHTVAKVRRLATLHPDAHLTELAQMAGTNPGRVSEILNGRRG